MNRTVVLLRMAQRIHQHLPQRLPLSQLGAFSGLSPSRLQREFTRLAGESPARYTRRLQLLRAAEQLARDKSPLSLVAARSGFHSPEVLIRNFSRAFGCTPQTWRRKAMASARNSRFRRGLSRVDAIARCLPFYHLSPKSERSTRAMPMLSTTVRNLEAQPALIIRSRVPRTEIAATIGQSLGRIVPYALGAGGALAGQPFARYPEFGVGMITIEVGMPLAAPVKGQDDIEAYTLPAGKTAVALHGGPYDKLHETFAAFEQWMTAQGHVPTGAPWELYVNDPADHPDPADWRTEIYWPVR